MKNLIPSEYKILAVSGIFHWFERVDLVFWFTGQTKKRVKWIEYNLPRMVKKGLLKERWHKGKKVYSAWSNNMHLEHGLICTKSLIRFLAANNNCEVVSENAFREKKFGVVPEWGIIYPNKTMLLYEYCTADNVGRNGKVKKKVNLYIKSLSEIEDHFKTQAVLLAVLDTKDALKYAIENLEASFAYFVDKDTFFSVDIRKQLTAPVYIWAVDGREYPLYDQRTD